MNSTSASEASSTATWSTPITSSTTQSWPSSTGYEQYYNYYQSVPPPVATTVAAAATATATTTTNYQQDYSQAWDEYYKAYYGQSYTSPATTASSAQYPASYGYDQYGYANFSAPPPNYYEPAPQPAAYDYTQGNASASSANYSSYNTMPATSVPPTTNWSEPPPSFTQPSAYNNAPQGYDQGQAFNHPPPIPSTYETSMDPNNMMQQSSGDQSMNDYYDQSNKQKYPKAYEYNSSNVKPNPPSSNSAPKEASYLEQFPPPSFGSPIKPNVRGRGMSNMRGGRQQPPKSNFNQARNPPYNRGAYTNKSSNDRRQFGNDDYSEDNQQFNYNNQSMANKRDNRGGFNSSRGRNMEIRNFTQHDPWYQEEEINDLQQNPTSYSQNEYENSDYFDQSYNESNENHDYEDSGYGEWHGNKNRQEFNSQSYSQHTTDDIPKREFETAKYPRMEAPNQKYAFDNPDQRMNPQSVQPRNGGHFPNNNNNNNNRPPFKNPNMERIVRPLMPTPRQPSTRMQNTVVNKPPVKLMDVIVQPSVQSPIIQRRQNMVDQWQRDIKEIHNRRMPSNYFWPILKSALVPEIQNMLFVNCFTHKGTIICELVLDDIFLVQGRGDKEEFAIESASKTLFDILKNRVYVMSCIRDADGDKVPGFCISSNPHGTGNLPPIYRPSENKPSDPCLEAVGSQPSTRMQNTVVNKAVDDIKTKPSNQLSDQGIFLVIESSTNERDQSIASLVATARFNNSLIDYQHEKLPHAPHISSCVITIDGKEIERHEARDYLVAKRQAADKVIAKLKQTRPQITLRFDKAKLIKKEELKKEDTFENSIKAYFQIFINSKEDIPLKFDNDFTSDEKNILIAVASSLNLSFKSEGKNTLFVFKQFSIPEMKNRLLAQGFCAQYQLIEKGSDCSSQ